MLRLIVREIQDNSVYFGACCVLGAITISVLVCMIVYGITSGGIHIAWTMVGFLFLTFGVLGAAQMYGDRANRVSTLLSTQAVTRNRILAARVLTGVATVLITLVPVFVASVVLLRLKMLPLEFYSRMVWDISIILALTGFACHGVGLLIGWTSSKATLIVGFLCLLMLLASLVVVKGFGLSAVALLVLLILAVWGKIWHTFTSASL
jgi:ABC-type transport system involved in multi-copper enzyme maturation permease subunit